MGFHCGREFWARFASLYFVNDWNLWFLPCFGVRFVIEVPRAASGFAAFEEFGSFACLNMVIAKDRVHVIRMAEFVIGPIGVGERGAVFHPPLTVRACQ